MIYILSSWFFAAFRIEISESGVTSKVLGVSAKDKVKKQEKDGSDSQIWTQVKENADGYFYLKNMKNPDTSKLLTAASTVKLKVTGNFKTIIHNMAIRVVEFSNGGY